MSFEVTPNTPQKPINDGSGVVIVTGPGGSPFVTDPAKPHLGGNFDGGDKGTMYPDTLWPWLIKAFGVKTMADVGCGTGETADWFASQAVKAVGVEGLEWNVRRCKQPTIQHDFRDGPLVLPEPVDLIWCADVAEHIAEEFVPGFIRTLTQCRVLAMCQGTEDHAALGWHHVNNKPESYWIEHLRAAGMIEDLAATAQSRAIARVGWWKVSGRIYFRE